MSDTKKPRVLIFGGMPKNIPNDLRNAVDIVRHITTDQCKRIEVSQLVGVGKYDCIIVITRFASTRDARILEKSMSVPCIFASGGWGKMQAELQRYGFLVNEDDKSKPKDKAAAVSAPPEYVPPVEVQPPASETTIGLPPEELWRLYGKKAIACVRAVLKPGEKVLEADIVDTLALDVGLPSSDLAALLPELALRGVLENVSGTTWRLASTADSEYEASDDRSEIGVKKPRKVPQPHDKTLKLIATMKGLPMGPYDTKTALAQAMAKYAEFRHVDGSEVSEWTAYVRIQQAMQGGVVEMHHGRLYLDHSDAITLTPYVAHQITDETLEKLMAAKREAQHG